MNMSNTSNYARTESTQQKFERMHISMHCALLSFHLPSHAHDIKHFDLKILIYNTDWNPTTITSTIPTSFNFWNYSLKSLDNSKWSGHSRNSCSFLFSSPAAPPKYSPRDFLYTPMNIPNVIVFEFCPISPPPGCPYHPPQASSIYIYTPPKTPQTQQNLCSQAQFLHTVINEIEANTTWSMCVKLCKRCNAVRSSQ